MTETNKRDGFNTASAQQTATEQTRSMPAKVGKVRFHAMPNDLSNFPRVG